MMTFERYGWLRGELRFVGAGRLFPAFVSITGVFLLCIVAPCAMAQVAVQEISLSPGWNAVFLEVTPDYRSCEEVFRGLPIASVWRWNPKTATHQFIEDPTDLAPDHPDWLVYFPPTSDERALSTLHAVHGGRPYLVSLRGALPATLTVKGQPAMQSIRWQADSFNLVGFSVSEVQGPTFQGFFAPSNAHAGQPMYTLDAQGRWERIATPSTMRLEFSRAYWVYCKGHSEYQGPVRVSLDQGRSLDFSDTLVESRIHIKNESAATSTFTVRLDDSEEPDPTVFPVRAGGVALSYWKTDYANNDAGWRDFDAPISVSVGAGKEESLRLAVRRADLPSYEAKSLNEDYSFQSLLSIDNGAGIRLMTPVNVRRIASSADKIGGSHVRAGLWVGAVTLNAVTEHVPRREVEGVQPTASEFQMKIILHVDASGTPRLLRHVTQLWRHGSFIPDPDDPQVQIVDRPGEYVLFTDLDKIDEYVYENKVQGAVLRDGTPAGRRLSTSIFGFNEPLVLSGAFPTPETPATSVAGTVTLDYDDPLNPFKHKYHPDHNNLRPDYATVLDEGTESWTVVRHLSLDFTETDPEFPEGAQAGWGDSRIGGIYTEILEGLHRDAITVQGTFHLRRVSNVAELDPEL